jgi:hypothetical protein
VDDRLMSYLIGQGMQPSALDRLIQKMEQTRGGQPLFSSARKGYRGNQAALQGQGVQQPMFKGLGNARI